jgi:hypothetical protein
MYVQKGQNDTKLINFIKSIRKPACKSICRSKLTIFAPAFESATEQAFPAPVTDVGLSMDSDLDIG